MITLPHNRIKIALYGLVSVNFLILIHEFGHFIAARLFTIGTPLFSIGFGPALLKFQWKDTIFQLAAIPFGGYVSMNQADISHQSIINYFIVCMAGIMANVLLGLLVASYLGKKQFLSGIAQWQELIRVGEYGPFIGPISIIILLGQSALINSTLFLTALGILSFNLALFNAIPLPPLDGGEFLLFVVQKNSTFKTYFEIFYLAIIFLFIIALIIYLIKRLRK